MAPTALMSLTDEEFRRQMLGASRIEILGEAGYDAIADLRESRQVHRKLLRSENDLVAFKAVELDHKIHGTLAPLAVHDPSPRFSVSIKLDGNLHNDRYRNDKDNDALNQALGEPVKVQDSALVDTRVTHHDGRYEIQASTPPTPPESRLRRKRGGVPTQPTLARPPRKSVAGQPETPRVRSQEPILGGLEFETRDRDKESGGAGAKRSRGRKA